MQMIKIVDLKPHEKNSYFFDDIENQQWENFLQSIKTSGVIEPIVITQDKVIVSGHQRVRACIHLNTEEIPCRVLIYESKGVLSKEEVILKDLIETNICQRGIGNINPLKMSRCIVELERLYGVKQGNNQHSLSNNFTSKTTSELAEDIGITRQQMGNYKQLQKLSPELQELVADGQINFTTAVKVWSKLGKEEQEKLLEYIGKENIKGMSQKVTTEKMKQQIEESQKRIDSLTEQFNILSDENEKLFKTNKELIEGKEVVVEEKIVEKVPDDYEYIKEKNEKLEEETDKLRDKLFGKTRENTDEVCDKIISLIKEISMLMAVPRAKTSRLNECRDMLKRFVKKLEDDIHYEL